MADVYLTDLVGKSVLQKLQDVFSEMTGMTCITLDMKGRPVTLPNNLTEYMKRYQELLLDMARNEAEAEDALRAAGEFKEDTLIESLNAPGPADVSGEISVSMCTYCGLTEMRAPIVAGDEVIGFFAGGQVIVGEPDLDAIRLEIEAIGGDPEYVLSELSSVPGVTQEQLDKASDIIIMDAKALSEIADGQRRANIANAEIERAAKMKSDFLANMSHEIRTPMNAVIGMAEMALREDIPDSARGYINQIKSSGRALLSIINDILDFSKIESGKMDIVPVEYEPMSLFHDVGNIIMTRLMDKDVELVLNMSANLPQRLFGDNIRIRQILINLANNAVKFTKKGQVRLIVDFKWTDEENILLSVAVQDTGIGIKKEDLGKIFESFQQVDSKRNRNVEGTGLGLSISKLLLSLMDGNLSVESEYNKGSRFTFKVPQRVIDKTPSMSVRDPSNCIAIGIFSNQYLSDGFTWDAAKLGVSVMNLAAEADLEKAYEAVKRRNADRTIFLFLEQSQMTPERESFIRNHSDVVGILVADFFKDAEYDMPNLQIVKKPLSAMNMSMIFNREKIQFGSDGSERADDGTGFIAPDAYVLIVDDNAINQTVAAGLLEPLKMHVETAGSGQEAIKKAQATHYDIIYMDHMMPDMDGIETTHKLRELPEYTSTPIVALTANAIGGAKEMFISEGLNDFVAKPIEVRTFISSVKKWLPPIKVQRMSDAAKLQAEKEAAEKEAAKAAAAANAPKIGDLDVAAAMELLGNESLYWNVLKEYHRVIIQKATAIKDSYKAADWPAYTIEVHALKSASKQIGAMKLSAMAMELEKAGNAKDVAYIKAHTAETLKKYLSYEPVLAPYFIEKEDDSAKTEISKDDLSALFGEMREALDNLDMDAMEEVTGKICSHSYPADQKELAGKLKNACADIDIDTCTAILDEWEGKL